MFRPICVGPYEGVLRWYKDNIVQRRLQVNRKSGRQKRDWDLGCHEVFDGLHHWSEFPAGERRLNLIEDNQTNDEVVSCDPPGDGVSLILSEGDQLFHSLQHLAGQERFDSHDNQPFLVYKPRIIDNTVLFSLAD